MTETSAVRRCGTCRHFAFGHMSVCTWEPPKEVVFPSSWGSGRQMPAVWVNDGKTCQTWELDTTLSKEHVNA